MSKIPVPIKINCGYSRVAIWEYSHTLGTLSINSCNKEGKAEKFQRLYTDGLVIRMPSSYWVIDTSFNFSKFDRHYENTFKSFIYKRWNGELTRSEYLKKFSTENWKKLSPEEKEFHSLSTQNLISDEEIDSMPSDAVKEILEKLGELKPDIINHHSVLKELQRSRKLVLSHIDSD